MMKENVAKVKVDAETYKKLSMLFTLWTVENCRPIQLVEDSGFKKVAEFLISVGATFGQHVDVQSVLPHPTTISRNIKNAYKIHFEKIKTEINLLKEIGFGLTSELWFDNLIGKTYIAVTIHYINEGNILSKLLAIKSMDDETVTGDDISRKVKQLLNEFDLNLDDKAIIVTDRSLNMNAAFCNNNHILSIDNLLNDTIEMAIKEVSAISELCSLCSKLFKYLKVSMPTLNLQTTLSCSTTRWKSIYQLFSSIEKNWPDIVQLLQEKDELNRIDNINLNHIRALTKVLAPFEETLKKLEAEKYATIHLVYIYIHRLKKKCNPLSDDLDITKQFKEKLTIFIDSIVIENLTMYHKIGLFLFPPLNKLIQFSEKEKSLIKDECKNIMKNYLQEPAEEENHSEASPDISSHMNDLYSDFLPQNESITRVNTISNELVMYENLNVSIHEDFNILKWWNLHQNDFPLLYKVSCKILATPASSSASERVFSVARRVMSEKNFNNSSNDASINEIMFLHLNIDENTRQNELFKYTN